MVYYIVGGIAIAIIIALLTYKIVVKNKRSKDVEVIKDVRYTTSDETQHEKVENENLEAKISFNKKDILIKEKEEKEVSKKGEVRPGKYTILATDENRTEINIRIGTYVRSYSHGDEIVLAEGDKIVPVSSSIILR